MARLYASWLFQGPIMLKDKRNQKYLQELIKDHMDVVQVTVVGSI